MNKKKVDNLLKGMAAAGAVLGGASIIGDADVVYAQENTTNGMDPSFLVATKEEQKNVVESESTLSEYI